MSEEDKLDLLAAILVGPMQFRTGSMQRAAAARVITFRRIKAMLAAGGTDPLPPHTTEIFGRMVTELSGTEEPLPDEGEQ